MVHSDQTVVLFVQRCNRTQEIELISSSFFIYLCQSKHLTYNASQ